MTRSPDALPAPDRLFALVFATCFAIGGANHARDLVEGGLLPYRSVPLAINAFWSLLCPVDLALAALIWMRRGTAIGLGVLVLLADVGANSWIAYFSGLHVTSFEPLQVQSLFLGSSLRVPCSPLQAAAARRDDRRFRDVGLAGKRLASSCAQSQDPRAPRKSSSQATDGRPRVQGRATGGPLQVARSGDASIGLSVDQGTVSGPGLQA